MDQPAASTWNPDLALPSRTGGWTLSQRLGFRFAFLYLALYNVPFPLGTLPFTGWAEGWTDRIWQALVPWVGARILHLAKPITIFPNGSGDTTFNYVQLLCFAALAALGTLGWSLTAGRDAADHDKLHRALRVGLRYVLAASMLSYGLIKVFRLQMPAPDAWRLSETYGESSPMGLMWTFMGASGPYQSLVGAAETAAGLLLLFRRTTTLGALLTAVIMGNVALMNFCYDVPVKLYSTHLLLMALVLLAPQARRILAVLLGRPVGTAWEDGIEVRRPWARRAWRTAKWALALYLVGRTGTGTYQDWKQRIGQAHPLQGLYEVESFRQDGRELPFAQDQTERWWKVAVSVRGRVRVRTLDDRQIGYWTEHDAAARRLAFVSPDTPERTDSLAYTRPDADHLTLEGTLAGHALSVRLKRLPDTAALLTSRGFHWISEVPYNR